MEYPSKEVLLYHKIDKLQIINEGGYPVAYTNYFDKNGYFGGDEETYKGWDEIETFFRKLIGEYQLNLRVDKINNLLDG